MASQVAFNLVPQSSDSCLICKKQDVILGTFNVFKIDLNELHLPRNDELFCPYCVKIIYDKYQKYKHNIDEKKDQEDQTTVLRAYWDEIKRKSMNRYPEQIQEEIDKTQRGRQVCVGVTIMILIGFVIFIWSYVS